jgi:hypothetical protein
MGIERITIAAKLVSRQFSRTRSVADTFLAGKWKGDYWTVSI